MEIYLIVYNLDLKNTFLNCINILKIVSEIYILNKLYILNYEIQKYILNSII